MSILTKVINSFNNLFLVKTSDLKLAANKSPLTYTFKGETCIDTLFSMYFATKLLFEVSTSVWHKLRGILIVVLVKL